MIHMAMKLKRQLKRKGTSRGKTELLKEREENASKKMESQPSRSRDIKCFRCLGSGHITSQCPNKREMILRDNGVVVSESEIDYEGMPKLEEASDGGRVEYAVGELLVTRRGR
ncbi:unnamed protein product [Fraxinus pennsylvanica]|uniref:CCHC-type domain-containing protein n=1 Tax=Fraxinus pennsylvanica TaxID=56036 RepID=A0AAD1ZB54_9LAMI|nr:unnamed protein product [Fraxinus pennsylvanica]